LLGGFSHPGNAKALSQRLKAADENRRVTAALKALRHPKSVGDTSVSTTGSARNITAVLVLL
jgi:hypothetical protein